MKDKRHTENLFCKPQSPPFWKSVDNIIDVLTGRYIHKLLTLLNNLAPQTAKDSRGATKLSSGKCPVSKTLSNRNSELSSLVSPHIGCGHSIVSWTRPYSPTRRERVWYSAYSETLPPTQIKLTTNLSFIQHLQQIVSESAVWPSELLEDL